MVDLHADCSVCTLGYDLVLIVHETSLLLHCLLDFVLELGLIRRVSQIVDIVEKIHIDSYFKFTVRI